MVSYPTPGIINNTRAVEVITQAISPDWNQLVGMSPVIACVTYLGKTYAVVDVKIFCQGVTTGPIVCAIVGDRVFRHG